MKFRRSLFFAAAACTSLILSGCVVPGYPFNGSPTPAPMFVSGACPPSNPIMPAGTVSVLPSVYAPPQVIVAPAFYAGYGWGYRYGNHYWPYRPNCGFWGGRYYGGYRWNGYRPGIHGCPYPHQGGYRNPVGWSR